MKNFLAIAAVAFTLPMAAAAQMVTERTVTCTIAEVQNAVGVCGKVEMPVPPRDLTVRVITTRTTDLGGLNPGVAGAIVVTVAIIAGLSGGGGSTPSTPGT